jgi:hypothetical protein
MTSTSSAATAASESPANKSRHSEASPDSSRHSEASADSSRRSAASADLSRHSEATADSSRHSEATADLSRHSEAKADSSRRSEAKADVHLVFDQLPTATQRALHPRGIVPVRHITLREVTYVLPNGFHQTVTIRGDDLLGCVAACGLHRLVPEAAVIISVVFDFTFADSPQPRAVEVRPPNTIIAQRPADAPIIVRWLRQSCFQSAAKLACALAIGLVALNVVSAPLDDDDDDDDHHHHAHPHLCLAA